MKHFIEELIYRIEGDYALAVEQCDEARMKELRGALKLARSYFAQGISLCMEFARGRRQV